MTKLRPDNPVYRTNPPDDAFITMPEPVPPTQRGTRTPEPLSHSPVDSVGVVSSGDGGRATRNDPRAAPGGRKELHRAG